MPKSKASPVRRRSQLKSCGPNLGATPSSTVEPEMQPCDRKAGVARSAFTHRFPPCGGQRGRTPDLRFVETGIVQEGWGDPFLHPERRRCRSRPCRRCPSACDPAIPVPPIGSGGSEPIMGWLSTEHDHDIAIRRAPASQRCSQVGRSADFLADGAEALGRRATRLVRRRSGPCLTVLCSLVAG